MANSHRRRSSINKVRINGRWLTGENEIRQGVVEAFKNLLTDPREWRAIPTNLSFSKINKVEAAILEQPFREEEVEATLKDMNGDKALGPDGFIAAFWQFNWDIVKEEIMLLFNEFYENAKFVRGLNATFIVLVPKKGGVEDIRDYRPINLVNSIYKLISKVMANKLKKVMDKLINVSRMRSWREDKSWMPP